MIEQNTHRLMMTILGIVMLGMIIAALFFVGRNPNDEGGNRSFLEDVSANVYQQNQNRTPKY